MSNPAQDQSLSAEEREYARKMIHALGEMHSRAECLSDDHFQSLGVPFSIARRAMFHATKHRSAMTAAHYLAGLKVSDQGAAHAAQVLADDLRDLILRQLPNSRETVARIDAREAGQ